jgi:hypothetical protein
VSTHTGERSDISLFTRARLAFRHFRWQRPFYAGLFTMAAGLPIAYFPYRGVGFGDLTIRMATTAGAGSLVIGVLMAVLGLTMWFQPHVRIFAGVAAIMLALVSLIVSNFGGFLLGFLFGLIGGAMSVAWMPGEQPSPEADEDRDISEREKRDRDVRKPGPGPEPESPVTAAPGTAAPGTGSAPAGFAGADPEGGDDPGKGQRRAE